MYQLCRLGGIVNDNKENIALQWIEQQVTKFMGQETKLIGNVGRNRWQIELVQKCEKDSDQRDQSSRCD